MRCRSRAITPSRSVVGKTSTMRCRCAGRQEFRWVEPITSARINPEDPSRADYLAELKIDIPLFDAEGNRHPTYSTLAEFFNSFSLWLSGQLAKTSEAE